MDVVGLIDPNNISYDLTVIKNTVRLSYEKADKLLKTYDDTVLHLSDQYSKEVELELRENL